VVWRRLTRRARLLFPASQVFAQRFGQPPFAFVVLAGHAHGLGGGAAPGNLLDKRAAHSA